MTLAHILSTAPLPVVPLFRSSCHEIQMAFAPLRESDSLSYIDMFGGVHISTILCNESRIK